MIIGLKIKGIHLGQAKLKSNMPAIDFLKIEKIAITVKKLCQAASENVGSDCYLHAALAQALLQHIGFQSEIVGGEAAWRVGEGDGDVILHAHRKGMVAQPSAYPYHAWVELSGKIFDVSTYQLHEKARQLDALDGQTTHVTWCPDFLFVKKDQSSSIEKVTMLNPGLFHYRRDALIEKKLKRQCDQLVDQEDFDHALLIYNHSYIEVFGPNNPH